MRIAAYEDIGFREKAIRDLLRGAQRYHFAALQDRHPVVAARHNAYAVALVDALWSMAKEDEVMRVTGTSLSKLRSDILSQQDKLEEGAFRVVEALKAKGITLPF